MKAMLDRFALGRNCFVGAVFALVILPSSGEVEYGVCSHIFGQGAEKRERTFTAARKAGFKWVRTDFTWEAIERIRGVYDFAATDELVFDAKRRGVKLLPILAYENPLYGSIDKSLSHWKSFVSNVVSRYSREIGCWEVWNEPNGVCGRNLDAETYAEVLKAAAEEIKAISPEIKVVLSGLVGIPLQYIETLYKSGSGPSFDIVNVHPYTHPGAPERRLDVELEKLRSLMARYGDAKKEIWISEIGWPTHKIGMTDGVLLAGLRAARPKQSLWRIVYAPVDLSELNRHLVCIEAIKTALPHGSVVDLCSPEEQLERLRSGTLDCLICPDEGYFADAEEYIYKWVTQGGLVVTLGGMPFWNALRRVDSKCAKVVGTGEALRKRLRVGVTADWLNIHAPKTLKVKAAKGVGGIVPPNGESFNASRFLTDDLLDDGDSFKPILVGKSECGEEFCAAGVFCLKEGGCVYSIGLWGGPVGTSDEVRQAKMAIRSAAISAMEGVEKYFWYELRSNEINPYWAEDHFGLTHSDFTPKPAYDALRNYFSMCPGSSLFRAVPWHNDERKVYFPEWIRPDGIRTGMLWATEGEHVAHLTFDGSPEFYDLMCKRVNFSVVGENCYAVQVSDAPIYYVGAGLRDVKMIVTLNKND